MQTFQPYEPRPFTDLGLHRSGDWRIKVHGIAHQRPRPRPELVEAARRLADVVLPDPGVDEGRYGVGFMGVHDGRGACFVFIDWWADENELHHHVFVAPAEDPTALEDRTATGLAACVWDLAVIAHERQAWIETVLANADGPDLDAYLDRRLEGAI